MFWPQHDLLTQEIKKKLYRLTLVGATTLVVSLAPGPTPKYPDSRKPLQQHPLALDRRSPFSLRQLAWVSSWQLSLRLILNTMSLTSKKQTNQKSRNLQLPYLVCVWECVCVSGCVCGCVCVSHVGEKSGQTGNSTPKNRATCCRHGVAIHTLSIPWRRHQPPRWSSHFLADWRNMVVKNVATQRTRRLGVKTYRGQVETNEKKGTCKK